MTPGVLHVLTGCTACGKTAAALAWAEHHDAEIVSCDSLLFYRGMDIGTAKPTAADRARVPHHLIDVAEVSERMDVKTYVGRASRALSEVAARGRAALVVGGSGFYLRSFFAAVTDDVPIDPAVRHELEQQLAAEGLDPLVRRLDALNPGGLGELDARNPRRVVRALERCLVSGLELRELHRRFHKQPAPFRDWTVQLLELAREPADLATRIAARARAMVDAGLIDEVRRLRAAGIERNPSAASAVGYRETLAWLDRGERDTAALIDAIATATRRLARKQRTWFRTQLPAHRVVALGADEQPAGAALFRG